MLQFISHHTEQYSYLDSIAIAIEGGCKWVQLRMKGATTEEMKPIVLTAQQMCRKAGATFIVDGSVELVAAIKADGVHLGKNDMPIAQARALLGKDFIIGGTANTPEDVRSHWMAGADYVGCGPYRFTTTKTGLSPILGIDGYKRIMASLGSLPARDKQTRPFPIVAIGGIRADDIPEILATGVDGIALSSAVLTAPDPVAEMRRLVELTHRLAKRNE